LTDKNEKAAPGVVGRDCEKCARFTGYNWEGVPGCLCKTFEDRCAFEPEGADE